MTFIPYVGSKGKIANIIINKMPAHNTFVDVFGGAGNIILRKEPSRSEIFNDINKELITLYRVVKNHLEEFIKSFKWALVSRDEFYRHLKSDPDTLTDIQRAVRFFYLQKVCFGGKIISPSYGYGIKDAPRFNILRIEEDLSQIHLRLARVNIECLPYQDAIKRYDKENTLFYLDPPYYDTEHYYGKGVFSKEDFNTIATILSDIQGRFLLSITDNEVVRELFKDFKIETIEQCYTLGRDNNKRVKELIIKNF